MQMSVRPASVSRRVCARGAIQPADILNFCKNHVNTDTGLGAALTGGGVWCPHEGNFADDFINAFLHTMSVTTVHPLSDQLL